MAESLDVLLLGVIAVLTLMLEKVRRDLADNTTITKETKSAANGTLRGVMEQLEKERRENSTLQLQLRDQENRIAFIKSRLPEAEGIMSGYQERRKECPYRNRRVL